jgi:polysaccharide export outer membrane protein
MPAQNINRNARTTQGQQDPPSGVVVEAPRVNPGALDPNATGAPVDPATYVIGPLDILAVKVFRDNDFTGQYQVRPDGKITLQLIGDMQAAGLTPERLSAQIKQALSDYLIKPDVVVQLYQVNSKTYTVSGEVYRAGRYPLLLPTHVFDAINDAGGFKDFANKKNVIIIRGSQRLKFNYEDVRKGKKLEQNVLLENGDTILIQ